MSEADTRTVDPFLPMPGDVHPSLPAHSWVAWSGMIERGHVVVPVPRRPGLLPDPGDPVALSEERVIFTLRKVAASLDPRFGMWWWWCWQGDDGRYVAAPMCNWQPREPYAWWWGSGEPLPE